MRTDVNLFGIRTRSIPKNKKEVQFHHLFLIHK